MKVVFHGERWVSEGLFGRVTSEDDIADVFRRAGLPDLDEMHRRAGRPVSLHPRRTRHGKGPGEILVKTGSLADSFTLEAVGTLRVASRTCIDVHAVAHDPDGHEGLRLGYGADSFRLALDSERGVLLRIEAIFDGRPFRVIEATAAVFDSELPDSLFEAP